MPSFPSVLLCSLAGLLICVCAGLPLARLIAGERGAAAALAPALGWAVFGAAGLPILSLVGFSRTATTGLCGIAVALGGAAALRQRHLSDGQGATVPAWGYAAAALLAILPTLALWPKLDGGGLVLADAMFDHSKIAIVDDMLRLGLPPGNPFYGGADAPAGLAYYYLWHFTAAVLAKLTGANGWDADIALTWLTAFASLSLMMGVATMLAGRRGAALLVLPLALAGSLAPVLRLVFGGPTLGAIFAAVLPPQSWLFQASWTPQHLASADCVVLAALVLARLDWPLVPLLGLVAAAAFESSAWVGGIVLAAGALAVGAARLIAVDRRERRALVLQAMAAALFAAALSYPLLHTEYVATAARQLGLPIALRPFAVLGPAVPPALRRALDVPAYWLMLLVVAFPAAYPAGAMALVGLVRERAGAPERRRLVALALIALASFAIASLCASTIANNDLGWRGVLPGIVVLTAAAAAGIARWARTAPARAGAAAVLALLALPGGWALVADGATGRRLASSPAFAQAPEMWAAVRRHTGPAERIASNPSLFYDTVQWPVNISWALFADRRSCFAGWNLAQAFAPLPQPRLDGMEALFNRVFAGDGSAQDIDDLATRFGCRVVLLSASDGAWRRDPFAGDRRFRLVEEEPGRWRIYRIAGRAATRTKVPTMRQAARSDPESVPATFDLPPLRRR